MRGKECGGRSGVGRERGWSSPGGSAPEPPFPAWSHPWISPAAAFPFPLAFVAQPSYTYLVPSNLPACQLFQPSHYFYGSSLSCCQLSGVGWDRARSSSSPAPQCLPSSSLCINSFCNFSTSKPFPCIFNLFLPVVALFNSLLQQLSVLKRIILLLPSRFSAVSLEENFLKIKFPCSSLLPCGMPHGLWGEEGRWVSAFACSILWDKSCRLWKGDFCGLPGVPLKFRTSVRICSRSATLWL